VIADNLKGVEASGDSEQGLFEGAKGEEDSGLVHEAYVELLMVVLNRKKSLFCACLRPRRLPTPEIVHARLSMLKQDFKLQLFSLKPGFKKKLRVDLLLEPLNCKLLAPCDSNSQSRALTIQK